MEDHIEAAISVINAISADAEAGLFGDDAVIDSLSTLHDLVDANEYLLEIGIRYGVVSFEDDSWWTWIGEVEAIVNDRLAGSPIATR